jgi:hypothetical protein
MLSIIISALTIGVLCATLLLMHLWRKLRDVHKRLHALEQRQLGQQRQLTISSRLACLTEVTVHTLVRSEGPGRWLM